VVGGRFEGLGGTFIPPYCPDILDPDYRHFLIGRGLAFGSRSLAVDGPTKKFMKGVTTMNSNDDKKKCPYCAEIIKQEAIKCRFCGSWLGKKPVRRWTRSRDKKMILGVCAGLAKQFNIDAAPIRLAFIIATIAGGWGLLAYLILWPLMPWEEKSGNMTNFNKNNLEREK
jgi:phage shock protein PspC (stress-responsive transcriptional regulator)